MNHQMNNLFHGPTHHKTCWIKMKNFVSWSRNTLNQDKTVCFMFLKYLKSGWNCVFHWHETHRFLEIIHLEYVSCCFKVYYCSASFSFMVFPDVSLLCFMLIHGVPRSFIALFHVVSIHFTALLRGASRCFKVFHCPAAPCFMTM